MSHFKTTNYNIYFEDFDRLVKYKGYVTGGGRMYHQAVAEFLDFLEKKDKFALETDINRETMVAYYEHLITRPGKKGNTLAQNTIKHHMFGLRLFFDMLLEMEVLDSVPYIPKFTRGHTTEPDILDQNEIRELYQLCKNARERAFLSAVYGCALRRSEVSSLNLEDLRYHDSYLIVRKGKGSKRREVPLSKKVKTDLYNYIKYSRPKILRKTNSNTRSLFVNDEGHRMNGQAHYRVLNRIIKRSENEELLEKNITLHSLRRSIATHLVDNGADIYFVKSFLGHVEINTSQLYAIRRRKKMRL
ncbi:MAG: tyrosine-type recombinase/integrase [Crocinitomicaceae bacterium]|nr:tyrosine-type recombinase/integrase [Crocinitomicaceae bacterium]